MRQTATQLTENILFMERKLAESRERMADMPIVVAYDNGGGQTGVRKNPMFDAYNSLMRTYNASLSQLISMVGEDVPEVPARGKLVKFDKARYRRVANG